MPRVAALLFTFAVVGVAASAPVPKHLKKKPASPDGTWRLTEFWSNGQQGKVDGMVPVWVLEGEVFYIGTKQESNFWHLVTPDPDKPTQRKFGAGRANTPTMPAAVEVDGDTLRFCYNGDPKATLTECKPAANVCYYVFTRVPDKEGVAPEAAPPADTEEVRRKRLVER